MSEDRDLEFPTRAGDLSTYALDHAIEVLQQEVGGASELVDKALATVRLIAGTPRRAPWYGVSMRVGNDSVELGTVLRNAFEALGDGVDVLTEGGKIRTYASNWFTQHYAAAWRQGKRDYYAWLDALGDPLAYEREQASAQMTAEQAASEYARIQGFLGSHR